MWIDGDILCGRYSDGLHLNLDIAKACVEARIFFAKGKSYPILVDMTGLKSTSKEASRYMATMGATLVSAGALVVGSPFNRFMGNIFLKIDKPPVPTRLFTREIEAKEWLMQFVQTEDAVHTN
jgi:hypothetical protein